MSETATRIEGHAPHARRPSRRIAGRGIALAGFAFALALGSLGAAPAPAQADAAAVGRLNYAGYKTRQHCTAFITDAGHLITAAHCLDVPEDARIHFLQGYDRGRWIAHVVLDPARFRLDRARDTAVACNAAPSQAQAQGRTLRLVAQRPRVGEALFVWGYGAPRRHVRQEAACSVDGWRADIGAVHLTCRLSSGASGAPLVRRLPDGTYDALGLVSRSGPSGTVAAAVERAGIAALCAE